jgi:hypothetical protein
MRISRRHAKDGGGRRTLAGIGLAGSGSHAWIRLFATDPDNVLRTLAEGILGNAAAAWLTAVLFVPVYNRLAER